MTTEPVSQIPCAGSSRLLAITGTIMMADEQFDTEDKVKLHMRLYAIEIVVANSLAASVLLDPKITDPVQTIASIRGQMVHSASTHTFPDVDPAMSQLLSVELEDAVDRLMEMATGQINAVLQGLKAKAERGS
jgi:hypothetical protein